MTGSGDRESYLSDSELRPLNDRQRVMYSEEIARFAEYLRTEGKNPIKEIGYADKTVQERVYRFHRMVKWFWSTNGPVVEFSIEEGDAVNEALYTDSLRQSNDDPYADGTKRKFNDVLRNWFAFKRIDWDPEYTFSDGNPENQPDPFLKSELKQLYEASLEYKTVPSYNNLTPEDRSRTKAYLAQELGKPKDEITRDDWDRHNMCWKIPSLIRSTRSHGWRPDIIGRMKVNWYDQDDRTIHIPAGEAPKNDASWTSSLCDQEAFTFDKWLEQRKCREKYDGREEMWLNREGNPYDSSSLNDLLDNLIEEAGISSRGRKLVWYSFRHSVGTYVYNEYTDLEIVAEQLRQKSRESASQYVHPLPELKKEAADIM